MPSEAYYKADTIDLYVLDIGAKWAKHQQDKLDGKVPQEKMPSQQEMLDMIKRARGE